LPGDHVELGEGTGLVHTAPGHGPDDFEIGKQFNLPIFCPVDEEGNFTKLGGKYFGEFVKDANSAIINDLKLKNLLFKEETIEHRYGTCWRCKTPIIYLATEQWFLKITEIKDKMLSEIKKVEWVPKWAGEGRFHDWVDNAKDWTISRQRYWGIPIPVWICEDCGNIKVIGSVKELKDNSINEITANDEDLVHRPYVDDVIIKCDSSEHDFNSNSHNSTCNAEMKRIPDVLDVWIDSGVAGWASLYYPQKKDMFNQWFPYDFITEGHDQTRGWFYSQLGTSVIAFNQVPYKKVLMHGFVLDEMGKKMSKSLGNVVQPEDVIEDYGADVLRFYLLWASKPWDDLKFVWDELNNVKKMFNILWNVYVFSTTYMALDNFNPESCDLNLNESNSKNSIILRDEDKWIISKANSLLRDVDEDLDNAFFHQATRKINNFILEDLSRWYVRLIRGRTWVEKEDPDKLGAYYGLYTAIELLIKVLAPIAPHISEKIYENLVKGVKSDCKLSIHMEDWEYDENLIDIDLENKMDIIREIIEASARARDIAKYKLRWPVSDITIVSNDDAVLEAVDNLKLIIMDQSNTKEVITSKEFENIKYIAKPNLKTLGPRLRQDMGIVKQFLAENDGNKIKSELETNGKIIISISDDNDPIFSSGNQKEGKIIELSSEDILFDNELPEDIVSSDFNGGNVFVNIQITPEILSEAMARELIRRIQDMRKDMDLDVEANINVVVDADSDFKRTIASQIQFISSEVRADSIIFENIHETSINDNDNKDNNQYIKKWKIENENIILKIET